MKTLVANTALNRRRGMVVVLLPLILLYILTLQNIPNGSSHYYMIDVGETQIVLNQWGTLHATGYPLYVMTGNLVTDIWTGMGDSPASAPAKVSMVWGVIALFLMYSLAVHLTGHIEASALVTFLFGLTRTVWIHNVIAEIYSFGLVILLLLFVFALWRDNIPYLTTYPARIYWLALIGGIGVAHHRAIAMAIPALLYATYPYWRMNLRKLPIVLPICLLLGLLGFAQYLYLPLRANAGAEWVYGDPGTWQGFLDQFLGREANRFIGAPESWSALLDNLQLVNEVLLRDVFMAGIILGIIGLATGVFSRKFGMNPTPQPDETSFVPQRIREGEQQVERVSIDSPLMSIEEGLKPSPTEDEEWALSHQENVNTAHENSAVRQDVEYSYRRPAVTFALSGVIAYGFHVTLYRDVLSALILPITLALAFGWLFWIDWMLTQSYVTEMRERYALVGGVIIAVLIGGVLINDNFDFINDLTRDETGLRTIEQVRLAPADSTVMLAWGPRFFAAAFAQELQNDLTDITLVDHNADFRAIVDSGTQLITPEYTFHTQSQAWWEDRLGQPVYLHAVEPRLVEITLEPDIREPIAEEGISQLSASVNCNEGRGTIITVEWIANSVPEENLSVFVHLLDDTENVIFQDDQLHPVYGWRPVTGWQVGEVVQDMYQLPFLYTMYNWHIRYGLYRMTETGFENVVTYEVDACDDNP